MLLQVFGVGLESESVFEILDWSLSEKLATPLHSTDLPLGLALWVIVSEPDRFVI